MTGQLRNFTGAAMTADHERRIRELERKLNASQTNLPRRTESEVTPTAVFENSGVLSGPSMHWKRSQTVGDTSWFQVPDGTAVHRIKILRPGILVATLNVSSWASGGPWSPSIRFGASIIASGRVGGTADVPDITGGFVVLASYIGTAGLGLSVNTGSASSGLSGRLTVRWYDGEATELTYP